MQIPEACIHLHAGFQVLALKNQILYQVCSVPVYDVHTAGGDQSIT